MNNVGRVGMREYTAAKAEGLIEPGIQILTDALHKAGVCPLSSCAGHESKATGLWGRLVTPFLPKSAYRPYVMFSAPESYARSLQKHYDLTRGFNYCWTIEGHFHPRNYELVWTINTFDVRLDRGDVNPVLMKDDLKLLATVAIKAVQRN
jgi:hypothetical protein